MLTYLNKFRNWAYDRELLRATWLEVPVVSVGNITMGGTGKSPFTELLCQTARSLNFQPGIVSRGYGRKLHSVAKVNKDLANAPELFGDEPVMLANMLPDCPVYVGSLRTEAARELLRQEKVGFIVADDAFQHRALHRDLDFVLLDATASPEDYENFPRGRAREAWSSLARADFVVVTKTNLVKSGASSLAYVEEKLKTVEAAKVLRLRYDIANVSDLAGQPIPSGKSKVLLVCGIARPDGFQKLVEESGKFEVVELRTFYDHYAYTQSDLVTLNDIAMRTKVDAILTTAKDAVKLKRLASVEIPIWVADLKVRLDETGQQELISALRTLAI